MKQAAAMGPEKNRVNAWRSEGFALHGPEASRGWGPLSRWARCPSWAGGTGLVQRNQALVLPNLGSERVGWELIPGDLNVRRDILDASLDENEAPRAWKPRRLGSGVGPDAPSANSSVQSPHKHGLKFWQHLQP